MDSEAPIRTDKYSNMQDLVERKRRAQEEEEEADPELKELRLRAMEAEAKMTKKKEENDPLFVYIIENFTLEMERVSPLSGIPWVAIQ